MGLRELEIGPPNHRTEVTKCEVWLRITDLLYFYLSGGKVSLVVCMPCEGWTLFWSCEEPWEVFEQKCDMIRAGRNIGAG